MNLSAVTKYIPNKLTVGAARTALLTQKSSPTLLFATGVVGVIATTVLASRATLKLDDVLEQSKDKLDTARELHEAKHLDYSDSDYRQDVAIVRIRAGVSIAKLYALPLAVGVVSIGCLAGSHHILTSRNVALTAAYAAIEKGFQEYRGRVVSELGEEKDREFRYGFEKRDIVVKETEKGPVTKKAKTVTKESASIYARFFDRDNTAWKDGPGYNIFFLQCQQDYLNDRLSARGHVFLNEAYDMLNLPRTPEGAVVGWLRGKGDDYIDFGIWDARAGGNHLLDFVQGEEDAILLDFNVDGVIWDKI